MDWLIIVLLALNLVVLAYVVLRPRKREDDSRAMLMLQHQMQDLSRAM